ncbi:type VII secretion protein EccE [Mycobacterium marinum]|uniref:type VII secretion protein EccE n=1 Tax=Mycobacterium marinum TaxID=1781 RepID=UPI002358F74D|nr:type VII secretion protein EccE [Mycobacterium marinum]MDC9008112.1 type VII secretion protein EccE [Mycobacterium marinum]
MGIGTIPLPGRGRISLAALGVIPAAMSYPWRGSRDQYLAGIAVLLVFALFGFWRGMHFTTILRRRLEMLHRRLSSEPMEAGLHTAALLRIGLPACDRELFPVPLLARYLNRYGLRADAIRITCRADTTGLQEVWIGITISAEGNLAALRARSPRVPLEQAAAAAARRLADYLREAGWEVGSVSTEDPPRLITNAAREKWRGVLNRDSECIAAYQVDVDANLPETLTAIWSYPARETWTALEFSDCGRSESGLTIAVACAFRTDDLPDSRAPLAGLVPHYGHQWRALEALHPASTQLLGGHSDILKDRLAGLKWPSASGPSVGSHRLEGTAPGLVDS